MGQQQREGEKHVSKLKRMLLDFTRKAKAEEAAAAKRYRRRRELMKKEEARREHILNREGKNEASLHKQIVTEQSRTNAERNALAAKRHRLIKAYRQTRKKEAS